MKQLIIEITENGFLVGGYPICSNKVSNPSNHCVFEDPGGLAVHIEEWAEKAMKEGEPVDKRPANPEMDNLTHITLAPLRTQLIHSQNSVRRSLSILENQKSEYAQHHFVLISGYAKLMNVITNISLDADNIGKGK